MLKLRNAFFEDVVFNTFFNPKCNLKLFKQSHLCYYRFSIRGDFGKVTILILLNGVVKYLR